MLILFALERPTSTSTTSKTTQHSISRVPTPAVTFTKGTVNQTIFNIRNNTKNAQTFTGIGRREGGEREAGNGIPN